MSTITLHRPKPDSADTRQATLDGHPIDIACIVVERETEDWDVSTNRWHRETVAGPTHMTITITTLSTDPMTDQAELLREALEEMVHGVESLDSSLPFSAPENISFLVNAKLGGPLRDAREALGWEDE